MANDLQHRTCNHYSLDSEEESIGNSESETHKQACRSPKHNNNTSSLGIGSKNTAAWGIMIDTGAAISLAPVSFAPSTELSPLEGTFQLRSVTGEAIQAYGRRTVDLRGSQLNFQVSFVIADVQHALLGMDVFMTQKLSLQQGNNNEHWLVNLEGDKTQLQQRGHHLYLDACPCEFGLVTLMRSSLPQENGSLLDDKGSVHNAASQHDLGNFRFSASGGAFASSFLPDDLRQQDENTAALGTALPAKGAKRKMNKKKKPSAESASHNKLVERSFEQQGQDLAATYLKTTWEKTSLINEIELAAGQPTDSLANIELQEISLRILLILSLRNKWQITTIRATSCSEEALGKHLRNIGLEQNKMDPNIFSGDELAIMLHESTILIGGTDLQQECFFCELSALISLETPTKLAQDTQVSFCNKTLEGSASS